LAPKSGCKSPDAAEKQRLARGAPAMRVSSLAGGSHGSMWSGQTGAPRCVGLRGSGGDAVSGHAAPSGHDGPTGTNLGALAFVCKVFMDAT
jgi:hypothetical protein